LIGKKISIFQMEEREWEGGGRGEEGTKEERRQVEGEERRESRE
jgi:hypothetical protein